MELILIFTALMLVFGVYAVMSRSIIRSAIGLALCSACLSMAFYNMGANVASMFELSVCSGLVTVVFIAGISFAHTPKAELLNEYNDTKRSMALPVLLIVFGVMMIFIALIVGGEGLNIKLFEASGTKELLWGARQADVWGQMAAILCGGVAITVLFRGEKKLERKLNSHTVAKSGENAAKEEKPPITKKGSSK